MQQTSPKAMQLNPSEAGWDHGLHIMVSQAEFTFVARHRLQAVSLLLEMLPVPTL